MRNKILSLLLISSFLLGSLAPTLAQETVDLPPFEEVHIETPMVELAPVPEEPVTSVEPPVEEVPGVVKEIKQEVVTSTLVLIEEPATLLTEEPVAVEETPHVSLLIRYGENIAWSGVATVATGTVTISATGSSDLKERKADSLLATLLEIDQESDQFSITDLDYYSSLDSFLINCISSTVFSDTCGQWQYVVNGEYPSKGLDLYSLKDGDVVYLYFGQPRRVRLSDSNIVVNESFTAIAESYDPVTNSYSSFPGRTVGITLPNIWPQVEVATTTTSTDGTAVFSLSSVGDYEISLKMPSEWGEFYDYPPTNFSVSSSTSEGVGGSHSSGFDFDSAYDFLESGQDDDGSWNTSIVTDWAAIALGVSGSPAAMRGALASYLREEEPDLDTALDYERHAMALMALGINPYTGGPSDYITPIVQKFDGIQMDEEGLVNDDAFAVITLVNAGYDEDDEIIRDMTAFVVSEQKSDGSWTGGVDVSGAYIQALKLVSSLPRVSSAINKAEQYMRDQQSPDGGFGSPSDAFATSWALQGIEALGDSPDSWKKGDDSPLSFLIDHQSEDGGMEIGKESYDDRAWATAYAIPAAKGLTWDDILRDFRKHGSEGGEDENNSEDSENSDTATTTDSTPPSPEAEILLVEPFTATNPTPVQNGEVLGTTDMQQPVVDTEETPTEVTESNAQTTAVGSTGAWEWIKKLFSSLWSSVTGFFS